MPAARPSSRPARPFEAQAAAEADYLRMVELRRMSAGELDALFTRDPAQAAPFVETAARYGLADAQLRLGQMRLDGLGVVKDEATALTWFIHAAKAGSPEAMNMTGRCLENGWGAPEDLAAAAGWYRRAAEVGYDWGEYNYANMLFDGRGVERDEAAAAVLYHRASDQGHARAMNLLARCYEEGWGVARDPAAATGWYRRSAEAGYFRAQFNHASLLAAHGQVDEALEWYDAAFTAAPVDGLAALREALAGHPHPRLAAFARDWAAEMQAC